MDSPIIINWVSPLSFLGVLGVIFFFILFFDEISLFKQNSPRWTYSVCLCPIKRTPGLNELKNETSPVLVKAKFQNNCSQFPVILITYFLSYPLMRKTKEQVSLPVTRVLAMVCIKRSHSESSQANEQ